ncbi:MAG: hypothetical protein Tsb0034_30870 [Ekhidna sp.]
MLGRLKNVSLFLIPYFGLFFLGLISFLYIDHGDFVLWLNDMHTPVLNLFFRYWTHTGDWLFVTFVTLFLLFFRFRFGLILGLIAIVQGLTTALLKQVFFEGTPRPTAYFEGERVLELIDQVRVQDFNSFPSGHTMVAFAVAIFFALMLQKNRHSFALFLAATLTALSRVYLGQHFLIDIMAGSLIGLIISVTIFFLFERYLYQKSKTDPSSDDGDAFSRMDLDVEDVKDDI